MGQCMCADRRDYEYKRLPSLRCPNCDKGSFANENLGGFVRRACVDGHVWYTWLNTWLDGTKLVTVVSCGICHEVPSSCRLVDPQHLWCQCDRQHTWVQCARMERAIEGDVCPHCRR